MIRQKIREIGENADKFVSQCPWLTYSQKFRYNNIMVKIELMAIKFFVLDFSLEIRDKRSLIITLTPEEEKFLSAVFRKKMKTDRMLHAKEKKLEKLRIREQENQLLNSINFGDKQ